MVGYLSRKGGGHVFENIRKRALGEYNNWGGFGKSGEGGLPGGQNAPGGRGSILKLFRGSQLPYI